MHHLRRLRAGKRTKESSVDARRSSTSLISGAQLPLDGSVVPDEFRCPLSGRIMSDPVIVASGQSYDRPCAEAWFFHGRTDCFKTGVLLPNQVLIPNVGLKSAILSWCSSRNIRPPDSLTKPQAQELVANLISASTRFSASSSATSSTERDVDVDYFDEEGIVEPRYLHSASGSILTAGGASIPCSLWTRPTSYEQQTQDGLLGVDEHVDQATVDRLVEMLSTKEKQEGASEEVRQLARRPANRRPLCRDDLAKALGPLLHARSEAVQVNAAAAVLNLSLEKENKLAIARAGLMPPLIYALRNGVQECQDIVAAALFSLALHDENGIALGVLGAVPALLGLLKAAAAQGRAAAAADACMALYYLSFAQLNRSKMVKAGAVPTLLTLAESELASGDAGGVASKAICILSSLAAAKDGRAALLESGGVERLFNLLKAPPPDGGGGELVEHAVAALLHLSRRNFRFRTLALQVGGAETLVALVESGGLKTGRAKEKVAALQALLREPQPGAFGSREYYHPRAYVRRCDVGGAATPAATPGGSEQLKAGSSHF